MNKYLTIITLITVFFSCSEKTEQPLNLSADYRYFPVRQGIVKVYQVEETIIDKPSAVYQILQYREKEIINGQMTDNNGIVWQKVEIYRQLVPGGTWLFDHTKRILRSKSDAQSVDNNIRVVNLVFPLKLYKNWDGNRYNQLDTLKIHKFIITRLHQPDQIGNFQFDSTIYISQKSDSSLIHKDVEWEKYATGIGLIYKKSIHYLSDEPDFDPTIPLEERITTGYVYSRTLISYELP